MPRLLRLEQAGAWYHVTARGNEQRSIYRDERDRRHFLELLPEWLDRFRVRLYAYVLMDNHYHLLLMTQDANLSRAMQWLNTNYSGWFNRRHRRAGHLFQGRFKAVVVEPESWALGLSRYVHLNPVRVKRLGLDKAAQRAQREGAGGLPDPRLISQRLEQLRQHRWSSYRAYGGWEKPPAWLECETVLALDQ
jgi:REP element-mobilizing transposase RayT